MPKFEVLITTPVQLEGAKSLADQLERDIGKAKALGDATEELEGKLKKVNTAISGASDEAKKAGEGFKVFGHGAHEVHTALSELGLGELAHGLFNPTTAAIASVGLAVKRTTEAIAKAKDELHDLIKSTREIGDSMHNALAKGAIEAADKIADLRAQHEHLRESIDSATSAMERQIAIGKLHAASLREQMDAAAGYAEAKVRLDEVEGKITNVDAAQQLEALKRQEEKRRAEQQDAQTRAELGAKNKRKDEAENESTDARNQLSGKEGELEGAAAAVLQWLDTMKFRQDKLTKAQGDADKAGADFAYAQEHPIIGRGAKSKRDAKEKADKALAAAQRDVDEGEQHMAELNRNKHALERETDRLEKLAEAREELTEKLRQEIDQTNTELGARQAASANSREIQDRTDKVNQEIRERERAHALERNNNRTPAEDRELQDLQLRGREQTRAEGRGQLPGETRDLLNQANQVFTDTRYHQGNAQHQAGALDEVHAFLERVIGHQEANVVESDAAKQRMAELRTRLENLESQVANNRPY